MITSKTQDDVMCKILKKIQGMTAEELLAEYWPENTVPVDIKEILNRIGISYQKDDFKVLSDAEYIKKMADKRGGKLLGVVFADKDFLNIFYKQNKCEGMSESELTSAQNRARFTLAHELAHCVNNTHEVESGNYDGLFLDFRFSDDKDIIDIDTYKNEHKLEYEANIFAGEILIPKNKLLEILTEMPEISINLLKDYFKVSENAMKGRLKYLGINLGGAK